MPRPRVSKRVEVRPGATAVAPTVDDPQGFAVQNSSDQPVTVSFRFDTQAHIMTVVLEGKQPVERLPPELSSGDGNSAGEQPL